MYRKVFPSVFCIRCCQQGVRSQIVDSNAYKHLYRVSTLLWRHNDHDCGSNYQPHGCLLNRLFRRKSKKTSKLRVTGLCVGNSPGPVNSPHKGPVTRKMFPFDDVIMNVSYEGIIVFRCYFIGNNFILNDLFPICVERNHITKAFWQFKYKRNFSLFSYINIPIKTRVSLA